MKNVLALALALIPFLASGALKISGQPNVTFVAVGPAGLRIEGATKELQVTERPDAVVVTVPLAKLSTGIGLRDRHMHEKYLETAKYPVAQLAVARAALKFPAEGSAVDASAPATLALHGKSKTVTFHYKASRKGAVTTVVGDVRVDMRDFGIEPPSYLGATVKPPVDVAVTFPVNET